MLDRCRNPNSHIYAYYGDRGISVCAEWEESFEAFRDWALSNGYRDDLTIERRDNERDYEPANCRWATRREQARNRRSNRTLEWRGGRLTLAELAERTGIPASTLHKRLALGWAVEKAATQPIRRSAGR